MVTGGAGWRGRVGEGKTARTGPVWLAHLTPGHLHQDLTRLFPVLGPWPAQLTLVWTSLCTNTSFWVRSILGILETAQCPAPVFLSCSPLLFPRRGSPCGVLQHSSGPGPASAPGKQRPAARPAPRTGPGASRPSINICGMGERRLLAQKEAWPRSPAGRGTSSRGIGGRRKQGKSGPAGTGWSWQEGFPGRAFPQLLSPHLSVCRVRHAHSPPRRSEKRGGLADPQPISEDPEKGWEFRCASAGRGQAPPRQV